MAAVPPPPHYNDHDHDHHQHSPHLDPARRLGLSCLVGPGMAAGGGGGALLATPASDDDDPGDLSGFSGNSTSIKTDTSLRIVGQSKRPLRADAAAAVAFLSSIAFQQSHTQTQTQTQAHSPALAPAPAPQPSSSSSVAPAALAKPAADHQQHCTANDSFTAEQAYHGASPTLVVSGTTQSLSLGRSPRDRAAISFLSAIDFGNPSSGAAQLAAAMPASGPPASFASSDQSPTPATGGTGTLDTPTPVLVPTAVDLTPVLASPRTFRSALASPRLSAAAAARSVRRKFRLSVHLSTAFSNSSSSSSNSTSNPTTLTRPDAAQPHFQLDAHPLSIDTTAALLASYPSSPLGPSPRTGGGRAPSFLSTTNAHTSSSPYPLPLSASDPPHYTSSTPFRGTPAGVPRRAAYLARASSLPVAWSSLFPFDRRTALPLAPSATPATAAAPIRATSALAGGDSFASLAAGASDPPPTTPVVVGMVAVVVAAALDKAGRRTLGGGGRPAVSFACMLAPTGALCSEAERRAAAALVVDANREPSLGVSMTGGVLAAVSIGSVDERAARDASGGAPPARSPQADVVCDFMLARAAACLDMIAGTERDAACSRRASDGSATASLDGIGMAAGGASRDRNDVVQMVHASLVDELDQQQHYQAVLPATGAATMAGADGGGGGGGGRDSAAESNSNNNNNNSNNVGSTAVAKPPRGTTLLHVMYDAAQLDDPALTTGRHKTVISLPGMMGSILQYTRPSELKKELNDKFRQTHPEVDPSLTLSQIRNLKRRLIDVGNNFDLEVSSLAKAFVYFEKLVLKRAVIKSNRRLVGAICLLLACKVNEPKESLNIGHLLEAMAKALGKLSVKDMRDNEFAVFAQLEFNLYLPQHEFMPHFERICAIKDISSLQDYIS